MKNHIHVITGPTIVCSPTCELRYAVHCNLVSYMYPNAYIHVCTYPCATRFIDSLIVQNRLNFVSAAVGDFSLAPEFLYQQRSGNLARQSLNGQKIVLRCCIPRAHDVHADAQFSDPTSIRFRQQQVPSSSSHNEKLYSTNQHLYTLGSAPLRSSFFTWFWVNNIQHSPHIAQLQLSCLDSLLLHLGPPLCRPPFEHFVLD
jgi:hypothetical protein